MQTHVQPIRDVDVQFELIQVDEDGCSGSFRHGASRLARMGLRSKKFHGSNRHFTSEVLICSLKIHYPGMVGRAEACQHCEVRSTSSDPFSDAEQSD